MMGHKKDDPYLCYFSIRSMAACLVTAAAFAFSIGHTSRVLFDQFQDPAITTTPTTTLLRQISEEESLPKPVHYRDLPSFFYSSRIYEVDSGHSVGFLSRRGEWEDNPPGDDEEPSETNNSADKGTLLLERTPVKQLLVDLKNADHTRLSSEARLAQTMLEFVGETGHAILSYRCHQPEPNRVDCIGMLDPRGHVTFRAWQLYDVVTIDMLVRLSQRRLENLAGRLQELFSSSNRNAKVLKISYKRRGSSSFQERSDQQSRHTRSNHQVEPYFLKKPILERQTDFHKIQIVQAPSTWRPQEPPKSSSSNDNSSSDRLLYLDGLFQSQLHDYASHEALVHPAMLCHEEPQRVLLVSASDGTALRQVLMHNTVQHVTVLERDPQLVETCREFFPSDCSDLIGSGAESCFDDPRVQAVYADPIAWLEEIAQEQKDKYDLIIVDSLSPQSVAHFSDKFDPSNYLPIDERSYRSFANALAGVLCEDEGVLVVHVGRQEGHHRLEDGPADSLVSRHYQNELLAHFSKNFQTAREYEQGDDRFLIAFRDRASTVFWNLGQDHVDLELAKRALPAASGLWPFRSFDGATMMQYQSPSRLVEDVYCRSRPQPPLCSAKHGMDPEIDNVPITSLHVRQSQIPNGGRGLFFTEAVPKGTYIAAEELVNGIFMSPLATEYSNEMEKYLPGHPYFEAIGAYAFAYGFANDFFGDTGFSIEPSRLCFINHGCNGTFVQGAQLSVTEMTADLEEYPDELANSIAETSFFSPFADRSMFTLMHINEVTLRDVNAGEELLDNYLAYYTEENWHCAVADVRAQCSNQAIGMVDRYQHAHDHDYDDVDNE